MRHPIPLLLKLAAFAIVAALLTAGSATAAKLITGKNIKNGSITAADIKKGSLNADRLTPALRKSLTARSGAGTAGAQGPAGPAGPAGPGGPQGPKGDTGAAGVDGANGAQGPQGPIGPSDGFVHIRTSWTISGAPTRTIMSKTLPAGTYVLNAKLTAEAPAGGPLACTVRRGNAIIEAQTIDLIQNVTANVALAAALNITAPAGDVVSIACNEGGLGSVQVEDAKLTAIRVGTLTGTIEP